MSPTAVVENHKQEKKKKVFRSSKFPKVLYQ